MVYLQSMETELQTKFMQMLLNCCYGHMYNIHHNECFVLLFPIKETAGRNTLMLCFLNHNWIFLHQKALGISLKACLVQRPVLSESCSNKHDSLASCTLSSHYVILQVSTSYLKALDDQGTEYVSWDRGNVTHCIQTKNKWLQSSEETGDKQKKHWTV